MKSRLQLYLTSDILVPQEGSSVLLNPGGTTASAPASLYSYLTGGGAAAGGNDGMGLCVGNEEPEMTNY